MNEKKIKICIFIKGFHNGGVEKVFENYFSYIDRSKFELHIVTHLKPYEPRKKYFEEMGFKIHEMSPVHVVRISRKNIKEYKSLFETYNFDIVHNNFPEKILPLYMAKKYKVPVRILHSHSDYGVMAEKCNRFIRPIYKCILKYNANKLATHCISCGKYAGISAFGEKNMDKCENIILHNAIDTEKFHYNPDLRIKMRHELNLNDEYVIGHIGRYEGIEKNQAFIIDVFAKMLEKDSGIHLLMIGDGKLRKDIIDKAKRLNILNKITFTGAVNNVSDYLQAMDCFLFPSLYEGFSVASIEVQCTGLKGVMSDTLDPEMNALKQFGVLSLNANVEEWADYLFSIKGYSRVDKAKELIEAGFDIAHEAKRLELYYIDMLKKKF